MRAKKGMRKIVVDDAIYYWKVKEDEDYFIKVLRVFNPDGACVLMRRYSLEDAALGGCGYEQEFLVITPAIVRRAILEEKEFNLKRAILDKIKYKESPEHWKRIMEMEQPGIVAGIGMDLTDDLLLCVCQTEGNRYRRTILDLSTHNVLVDDQVIMVPKNKEGTRYLPFGPLNQEIPCLEWSPAARMAENQRGDKICCYSFYSQFLYFQPVGNNCLQAEHNQECVRLNKTDAYNKYAFSASGDYFVIVEKNRVIIWKRE